jgi:hypothetical protein
MNQLFQDLFVPFSDEVKQSKTQGGQKVTFVSWIHYVVRAWETFPLGYSKDVRVNEVGGQLVVTVRITDNDSGAYQEALGAAPADKTSWGGAMAEAESQAFRRAMANFGLGLEMYMDDEEFSRVQGAVASKEKKAAADPENVATPRQMECLRQLGTMLDDIGKDDADVAELVREKREFLKAGVTKAKAGIVIKAFRETLAGLGYEDPTKQGEDG